MQRTETAETLKPMDLKELTAAKPPCITVCFPFDNLDAARVRVKNLVREVEQKLPAGQVDKAQRQALLEPLREVADSLQQERGGEAMVLFRSPEVFTSVWLTKAVQEAVTIAGHF